MVVVLSSFEFTNRRLTQTVFYYNGELIFTDSWAVTEYNRINISDDI